MDQLQRVRDLLSHVTYKPGWVLSAEWEPRYGVDTDYRYLYSEYRRVMIYLMFKTKDAIHSDRDIELFHSRGIEQIYLRDMSDGDLIRHFICRVIKEAEDHEFNEWFKMDGFCVFDPHPHS